MSSKVPENIQIMKFRTFRKLKNLILSIIFAILTVLSCLSNFLKKHKKKKHKKKKKKKKNIRVGRYEILFIFILEGNNNCRVGTKNRVGRVSGNRYV